MSAGPVVWLVRPDARLVEVYVPGQRAARLGMDGTLDGGSGLPGFTLPVRSIFPE